MNFFLAWGIHTGIILFFSVCGGIFAVMIDYLFEVRSNQLRTKVRNWLGIKTPYKSWQMYKEEKGWI